jgi:hypothetical protein
VSVTDDYVTLMRQVNLRRLTMETFRWAGSTYELRAVWGVCEYRKLGTDMWVKCRWNGEANVEHPAFKKKLARAQERLLKAIK